MAARDTDPQNAPRTGRPPPSAIRAIAAYWQALAECYLADHNYRSRQGVGAGEQAATDPARARAHAPGAIVAIEGQRLDYEDAEKQRQADEDARELAQLKSRRSPTCTRSKPNTMTAPPSRRRSRAVVGRPHCPAANSRHLKQVDCLGIAGAPGGGRRRPQDRQTAGRRPRQGRHPGRQGKRWDAAAEAAPVTIEYFPKPNTRLALRAKWPPSSSSDPFHRRRPLRWLLLSVFVLSSAINYLDRQSLATLAPLVRAEFHLSRGVRAGSSPRSRSPTPPARRSPAC
jgi:hypothetical protein